MKKILLTGLTLALVIGGTTAVFAAVSDDPAPSHTTRTTSTAPEDVSGPCDEAEHANDPRCASGGGRHHETAGDHHGRGRDDGAEDVRDAEIGEDVPGPCDEAEHANDPRCAPGVPAGDDPLRSTTAARAASTAAPGAPAAAPRARPTIAAARAATAVRGAVARATTTELSHPFRDKVGEMGRPLAAPSPAVAPSGYPYDQAMAVAKKSILLVEDEASIVQPLADALAPRGLRSPRRERRPPRGSSCGRKLEPDLVLLDLMLPDGSGFDVCRELRRSSDVPIVMLTARGDEADRVVGLELGADDYVVKPFSAREVIARIRAVLRRAGPTPVSRRGTDRDRRTCGSTRNGAASSTAASPWSSTRKEFELLHRLMRDAGRVITREQLIEDVWDMNWFGSTKTLDVHVSSLRRKLEDRPVRAALHPHGARRRLSVLGARRGRALTRGATRR